MRLSYRLVLRRASSIAFAASLAVGLSLLATDVTAAPPPDGANAQKDDGVLLPEPTPSLRRKREGEAESNEGGGEFNRRAFRQRMMQGDNPPGGDFAPKRFRRGEGQGVPPMMRRRLQGGRGRMDGGLFGRRPLDFSSLNLTDAQKQQIQKVREKNGGKAREMRKSLGAMKVELRDLMFDAGASDDQIRSKRKEIRQLQDKVEDIQINDFLSIRSVLTPEQKVKLADLKPTGRKMARGAQSEDGGGSDSPPSSVSSSDKEMARDESDKARTEK